MTQNGQPDNPRSARYVLKDFVNGKLLYCVAPPMSEQHLYHIFPPRRRNFSANKHIPSRVARINQGYDITADQLDRKFFQDVHVKGARGPASQHCLGVR
jgi:large subunit GTPase 1